MSEPAGRHRDAADAEIATDTGSSTVADLNVTSGSSMSAEDGVSASEVTTQPPGFAKIRLDFPVLAREVNGRPLVYLDSAASSQMPAQVAERIDHYHRYEHANVHRGIHTLSQEATDAFEQTRDRVQHFLGAANRSEIIFTSGTTDSINLVAHSYGGSTLRTGDEILLTQMEHHANIVPWQMIAERTGAKILVADVDEHGNLDLDDLRTKLSNRTKIVALVHVSNALGTVNPVQTIIRMAREQGAIVLLDGAQSAPHQPVNVQELDCDFYAFSAHKVCGPTGFGILYGKKELLEAMPPYRGGGEMISRVSFEGTTYEEPPFRFEAGTPPIAAAIGLGAAIEYLQSIGMEQIALRERELLEEATKKLAAVDGLRIIGNPAERSAVLPFVMDGIHASDIGTLLDKQGIAVRTGHHCAQPIHDRYGLDATARASFAFYNSSEDIDRLVEGLEFVKTFF